MGRLMKVLSLAAGAGIAVTIATPAQAAGCNGVVNPFVWGCAPWDNNNGPRYPYYRTRQIVIPANQARVEVRNGVRMVHHQGQWHPVVSAGSGNIVAVANVVSAGGLN